MLFETGLSGISSLCVFWRMRMASVELIDRLGSPSRYGCYNGYLIQGFSGQWLSQRISKDIGYNSSKFRQSFNRNGPETKSGPFRFHIPRERSSFRFCGCTHTGWQSYRCGHRSPLDETLRNLFDDKKACGSTRVLSTHMNLSEKLRLGPVRLATEFRWSGWPVVPVSWSQLLRSF